MTSVSRLTLAALTGISVFSLLITLVILWFHWFLPDPLYTANSYSEVIQKELAWGIKDVLIELIILFFPVYIISLFVKRPSKVFTLKRFFTVLGLILVASLLFTSREVLKDLEEWRPLEKVTQHMQQRTFDLGRTSFIPTKQYTVYFTTKTSDFSFIKQEIIPNLESFGYSVSDFGVSIGRQHYTSVTEPSPTDIQVQSINNIPLNTSLQKLDYAGINFVRRNPYGAINLLIHNYEGNNEIKGMIRK